MPYFTNFPKPYGHVHPLLRLLVRVLGRTQISMGLQSQSFICFMVKPPQMHKMGRVIISEESTYLFPNYENFSHRQTYTISHGIKKKHSTFFSVALPSVPALKCRLRENSQSNELEKDGREEITKFQDEWRGTEASLPLRQFTTQERTSGDRGHNIDYAAAGDADGRKAAGYTSRLRSPIACGTEFPRICTFALESFASPSNVFPSISIHHSSRPR